MFESSTNRSDLLRAESYLRSEYEPDKPVGREQELDMIATALRPLTKRRSPENVLAYGPAGVGKTTSVRHVLEQLEAESRVNTVYINCWQYDSRSALLTELLIQLGYPAPRKGKPVDELLSRIRERLDKNYSVAVVLDEFDKLEDQTEVAYDLQLVSEEAEYPLGAIMVSQYPPSEIELERRSESRVNFQPVEFEAYPAPVLRSILEERVEQAFHPGTVTEEVIGEIAERVASVEGDCREALEMLLRAGRRAEESGDSEVTKAHLDINDHRDQASRS